MTKEPTTLSSVCAANILDTKWLVAPSHRVGHQWIEVLVRSGQSVVNLHSTTVLRLALDLAGSELAGRSLASRTAGSLVIDAAWNRLPPNGYLGQLEQSADLSTAIYESLLSVRLAGASANDIDESHLESGAKAKDIVLLLKAYEEFLDTHALVDEADVLRIAAAKLKADPLAVDPETLILIPQGFRSTGIERRFLNALPLAQRIAIIHPVNRSTSGTSSTDVSLLADIGRTVDGHQRKPDGSVQFFRAVGEINEVREVFRRCLADDIPLDDVEILHTESETFVPLIYATARRYFSDSQRPEGIPLTFAEGIPASVSRPGRALTAWLRWISEDFPQRLLVEMIGEGLLNCGEDDGLSFSFLVRLLRPIAIGLNADNYLPKLDEQIKGMRKSPPEPVDDSDDRARQVASRERKLKGLQCLRKLTKQLVDLSGYVTSGDSSSILDAAEKFLLKAARSVSQLDVYAAEALIDQLQNRKIWLDRIDVPLDLGKWLEALPSQTRVLGSGPRPGHLHVAHLTAGGHSGRERTFVIGLDDRRFPGAVLQDPILLDSERASVSPELSTSSVALRQTIDELAVTLSRLSGTVTLSWPCHDLVDDRESFPSPLVLSAYRLISGTQDADLDALNTAVGPAASFAPATAEKSLDESERWLWRLSDEEVLGTNRLRLVEAHFPHLASGSTAQSQQSSGFGPFNGCVPQAGADLNPFATTSPALSASALETAGRCPLAFFFRNGLKLFPPDELEIDPDRWIDAAQFGSLLHDVFRRFMDEVSSAGKRPQFERDHTRLAEILHETVQQWRRDVPPPNENAFRMQYWQLVRTSRIFLQAEEEFCQTSQPRFFEVALGLESVAGGSPLDAKDPATVTLPNGKSIRTRGQIDRVDETGEKRYAVWDYKVGSGYGYERIDPFRQGRRVQSVLYLRMIETALRDKLDPDAVVERFGYFFPSIRAHGLRVDWNADTLEAGMNILEQVCSVVADGAFPATDNVDDCTYCKYVSICRDVRQVTAQSKALLDRNDLVALRTFRELRRG